MDKIEKIKSLLILDYFSYLRKLQKGYTFEHYEDTKNNMIMLSFIEKTSPNDSYRDIIIDKIINNLTRK